MTIAISGKSGCGNSTVSGIVAESLGLRLINYTFRSLADDMGTTFEEVCRLAERDFSYDRRVDDRQVQEARAGNCVLGSRLAIWLVEEADLKVYLEASLKQRARRIQKREGGSLEEVVETTERRDGRDRRRYQKLYGFDIDDYEFADLIVDTTDLNQYQVSEVILQRVRSTAYS